MRSINPAIKLVGLFSLTIALAGANAPVLNLVVFASCLVLTLVAGASVRSLAVRMIPIALVAVGLFMTGYRFAEHAGSPVKLGGVLAPDEAVTNGLILSTRVLVYAGLGFLFALTTDKLELVRSLQHQLRMPATFAYAIVAAWNILPDLEHEYRRTRLAFRARGLSPLPFSPSLLKPMLVKSVLWSQALAVAMESKGFDGRAPRTEWHVPRVRVRDVVFLTVTMAGAAGLLVWR